MGDLACHRAAGGVGVAFYRNRSLPVDLPQQAVQAQNTDWLCSLEVNRRSAADDNIQIHSRFVVSEAFMAVLYMLLVTMVAIGPRLAPLFDVVEPLLQGSRLLLYIYCAVGLNYSDRIKDRCQSMSVP